MKIALPDTNGTFTDYTLTGTPIEPVARLGGTRHASFFQQPTWWLIPFTSADPSGAPVVDWDATMVYRRYLADLGLGIAEAMDTAQRGMGLDWAGALELIRRTKAEVPDALVFNGCGTEQLDPDDARSLDDVRAAYLEQVEAIQNVGGRLIIMASRALWRVSQKHLMTTLRIYSDVLAACDAPVILHWLGPMFDPALAGYWGTDDFEPAMETALAVINENVTRVDGIKISLLDKDKEIIMRRRLPESGQDVYRRRFQLSGTDRR